MDFHSLTRRELQALCKNNKIPANMTNVAMADALKALQNVEGLEEFLNPSESQNPQSPEKLEIGSPEISRTVGRTSTRRRPIKAAEEPESSQTLTRTRRGTRRIKEEINQEKIEALQTPVVPSSRKRAPAASTRQKTTRAEPSSVQRVYSTRRSARLSEKLGRTTPMEVEFSKVLTKDLDEVEEENKGSDLQTISEDSSKITNDSEVVLDQKSVQSENSSKAEESTEESAKPDDSEFIEVSEVHNEAHDEQNTGESSEITNSEVISVQKPFIEVSDVHNEAHEEQNTGEGSKITNSDVVSVQKPAQSEHDSLSEVEESTDESTKPNNSDFPEVSEVKDGEALDEQNTEAEMQKIPEVDWEEMDESNRVLSESPKTSVHLDDESIVEKGIDVSSVTMPNIEDLNEDTEMEKAQQPMGTELALDLSTPPQAFVDDSSCDAEKPEFSMTAFADEVVCENPVSMDSKMNATSEGRTDQDDDDDADDDYYNDKAADQGDSEEFEMELKQKATDMELEEASVDHSSCDSEKPDLSSSNSADEVVCQNPVSMGSEMNVTSEISDEEPEDGKAENQEDSEEFDMDLLNQKETDLGLDIITSDDSSCDSEKAELSLSDWMHSTGSNSSVVVDQSEAQTELQFATNQGSMDSEDVFPETEKPKTEENADEINNSVELITAEENATAVDESLPFLDSFPTPVKLMSPHRLISNNAVSGRTPLSPLAASSPLLGMAALPTLSTPTRKSSSKKKKPSAAIQRMTLPSDNKENLDNSGRKILFKPETGKKKNSSKEEPLSNTSIRQLKKMLKKLKIKENTNKSSEDTNDVKEEEVAKTRPALQTLPENYCMAKVETGKEN